MSINDAYKCTRCELPPSACVCSHDAVLTAKRRADKELKGLRSAKGLSFLERHQPALIGHQHQQDFEENPCTKCGSPPNVACIHDDEGVVVVSSSVTAPSKHYQAYVDRIKSAIMQRYEGHMLNESMTDDEVVRALLEAKRFLSQQIDKLRG